MTFNYGLTLASFLNPCQMTVYLIWYSKVSWMKNDPTNVKWMHTSLSHVFLVFYKIAYTVTSSYIWYHLLLTKLIKWTNAFKKKSLQNKAKINWQSWHFYSYTSSFSPTIKGLKKKNPTNQIWKRTPSNRKWSQKTIRNTGLL